MSNLIGFIGKGGTGKSTLTALFLKYVLHSETKPVLVIDADANSSLAELLSLEADTTIGNIREEVLKKKNAPDLSSISKQEYAEYALHNSIIESIGYDLVVMGRPPGQGCYCFVNSIVKMMLEKLKKNYKLIVVDCEAGLEHLSRKTLGDMKQVFIVSDPSRKGVVTGI
ncbi:AAA family ATPase, partial [Thermoproteota archaeon]